MRTTQPKKRSGKQIGAGAAVAIVAVVVVLLIVLGYKVFLAPKPVVGSGLKPTKAAVQAMRQAVKVWDEEQKRARAEGRSPDLSKMPKRPSAYLNQGVSDAPNAGGMPAAPTAASGN